MAGNFATTAAKDFFEAAKGEADALATHSPELASPALTQDADAFAQFMQHYEAPVMSISALQGSEGASASAHSRKNPFVDVITSVQGVTKEWQAAIQHLDALSQPVSVKDILKAQYAINKTSSMMNLVGNLVGKSVQHLETLLRMQ